MKLAPRKQGKVVRPAHSQTGKTHKKEDKGIHPAAMHPGARVSRKPNAWGKGGKPYYEGRRNRSDMNKKKRLWGIMVSREQNRKAKEGTGQSTYERRARIKRLKKQGRLPYDYNPPGLWWGIMPPKYPVKRKELDKVAALEREEHPWMGERTSRRIARDHLQNHPQYRQVMPAAKLVMRAQEQGIKRKRRKPKPRAFDPLHDTPPGMW